MVAVRAADAVAVRRFRHGHDAIGVRVNGGVRGIRGDLIGHHGVVAVVVDTVAIDVLERQRGIGRLQDRLSRSDKRVGVGDQRGPGHEPGH